MVRSFALFLVLAMIGGAVLGAVLVAGTQLVAVPTLPPTALPAPVRVTMMPVPWPGLTVEPLGTVPANTPAAGTAGP